MDTDFKTYSEVKDTVLSYLHGKGHKAGNPTPAKPAGAGGGGYSTGGAGGLAPMDIDAIVNKAKKVSSFKATLSIAQQTF